MYLAKTIKTESGLYIYDALSNKFALVNSEQDLLDDKYYAAFLRDNDFRDVKKKCEFEVKYPLSKDELTDMFNKKVKSITLALTEQCNLRCKYCGYMAKYMDHNYHIKEMTKETAFKAIDFLMKHSQESDVCNIGFYGGEPLLKINLIKECVAYVKERYPFRQPTYNITTNATLIEEKIAIFLIENNFKITISLDGPYREQNKYRVDRKGNASYKNVYRGIEILYQKDPRYFKGNVNYNVVMYNGINRKLLESLEYLWKSDVTLIDLFETEYFKKSRDNSDEESVDEKIDEKNFDIVYRNLLLNMKKYQNAFNESDVNKTIFPGGFCVPGVRKNFITADGKIIICEKVDERQELFRIGDIYNGIDMERVNKLMNETEKRLSKCKYCWAARFCNICFMDVLSMKQEYCDQSKENIEKELGYYISRISPDRELVNYIANISLI